MRSCGVFEYSKCRERNCFPKDSIFGDHQSEAKARRKKWADLVKLKCAKWTATASSAHVTLLQKTLPGGLKQQRTLIKDEIGILPIPRFQQNMFEEEEVSVHACCFGLVSVKCRRIGTLLLILQQGFPRTTRYIFVYVHCYICNSVDFKRSNACINTTITW